MGKEIRTNLISWYFFTLVLGTLPILFLFFASLFNGNNISIKSMSKELFFLTIILCADTLKSLNDIDNKRVPSAKRFLLGMTTLMLIVSSVLYGFMLIYGEEDIKEVIYMISTFLCLLSIAMGLSTQILTGYIYTHVKKDD